MPEPKSVQEGRMTKKTQKKERLGQRQTDRSTNEQDRFLDFCQKNRTKLTVYLESGRTLIGVVVDHDRKVLLLGPTRSDKDCRLIEKSYIAIIRADEHLDLFLEYKGLGNAITRKKERKAKQKAAQAARELKPAKARAPKATLTKKPSRTTKKDSGAN